MTQAEWLAKYAEDAPPEVVAQAALVVEQARRCAQIEASFGTHLRPH